MQLFECDSSNITSFSNDGCECSWGSTCNSTIADYALNVSNTLLCCVCSGENEDEEDSDNYVVGWELISLCVISAIALILGVALWITCNLKTLNQGSGTSVGVEHIAGGHDGQASSDLGSQYPSTHEDGPSKQFMHVDPHGDNPSDTTNTQTVETTPANTTGVSVPTMTTATTMESPNHNSHQRGNKLNAHIINHNVNASDDEYGPVPTYDNDQIDNSNINSMNTHNNDNKNSNYDNAVTTRNELRNDNINNNNNMNNMNSNDNRNKNRQSKTRSSNKNVNENNEYDAVDIVPLASGASGRMASMKRSQSKPGERTHSMNKYKSAKNLGAIGHNVAALASEFNNFNQTSYLTFKQRKSLALRIHADPAIKSKVNVLEMTMNGHFDGPQGQAMFSSQFNNHNHNHNNNNNGLGGGLGAGRDSSHYQQRNSSIFSNSSLLDRGTRFRSHKSDFPELKGSFENIRFDGDSKAKSKFKTRQSHTQDDMFYNAFDQVNFTAEYDLVDTSPNAFLQPLHSNNSNITSWDHNREQTITAPSGKIEEEYYANVDNALQQVHQVHQDDEKKPPKPKKQLTKRWNGRTFALNSPNDFIKMSERRVFRMLEPKSIDSKLLDWENASEIGHGSFGIVLKTTYQGEDVAVKKLHATKLKPEQETEFKREAAIMQRFATHPRIIRFFGVCYHDNQFCIVTEYMENGSMWDALFGENKKKFEKILTIEKKLEMVQQAAHGINHLHKELVIHRDISARNLLIDARFNIKIADLGMARLKSSNKLYKGNRDNNNNNNNNNNNDNESKMDDENDNDSGDRTNNKFGPIRWMAPECIYGDGLEYSEKTDSYAFGITLYEIFAVRRPFEDIKNLGTVAYEIYNGARPKIDDDINIRSVGPPLSALMEECWQENPSLRPSFDDIVEDLKSILKKYLKQYKTREYREDLQQEINKVQSNTGNDDGNQLIDKRPQVRTVKSRVTLFTKIHKESVDSAAQSQSPRLKTRPPKKT